MTRTGLVGGGDVSAGAAALAELAGLAVPPLGGGTVVIGGIGVVGKAGGGTGDDRVRLGKGQNSAPTVTMHKSRAATKTHSRAGRFFNAPPIRVGDS